MDKKFNFNGGENILKSICWILSYLSWLLLAINNLASLKWLYNNNFVWNIIVLPGGYFPIQMDKIIIYIIFNFEIIVTFIGCIVFFVKTLIKPEDKVIDGMMGKFSQFHFFPLICAFIMTVLGEALKSDNFGDIIGTGLAFSLFGIASMIFIYINTECESVDWWTKYFLKNGTYSCLIVLFWYNFCYDIFFVRVTSKNMESVYFSNLFLESEETNGEERRLADDVFDLLKDINDIKKWAKGCGMAFSLIFGIGTFFFSYAFKDIIICLMNILIYYGMAKFYFNSGIKTNDKDYNKNGDGAIDFIILICSVLLFIYFIIEKLKDMKNSNVNAIVNTQGNVNEKPDVNTEIQTLKNQILNIANVQNQTIMKVNSNSEQINLISNKMNLTAKA